MKKTVLCLKMAFKTCRAQSEPVPQLVCPKTQIDRVNFGQKGGPKTDTPICLQFLQKVFCAFLEFAVWRCCEWFPIYPLQEPGLQPLPNRLCNPPTVGKPYSRVPFRTVVTWVSTIVSPPAFLDLKNFLRII